VKRPAGILIGCMNVLATMQCVWFYLGRVPSALNESAFEAGGERLPFQQRLLMMLPLRWAHRSPAMQHAAQFFSNLPGWFPSPVHPEDLVEAAVDLVCVAVTGWSVRRIYQAASRTGLLTPFAYPLTLLMMVTTYALLTTHAFRFVYDLPSLACFALGMYLIYFRRSPVIFALVFLLGTINRETSLFLLPLYGVAACLSSDAKTRDAGTRWAWRRLGTRSTLIVIIPLAAGWIGWHLWVSRHFSGNASPFPPHLLLNIALAACVFSWPQMLCACSYCAPLVLGYRRSLQDPLLRAWIWLPLVWFACMLSFGLLIEPRIFGELIPYIACCALLIAEQSLVTRFTGLRTDSIPIATPFASAADDLLGRGGDGKGMRAVEGNGCRVRCRHHDGHVSSYGIACTVGDLDAGAAGGRADEK